MPPPRTSSPPTMPPRLPALEHGARQGDRSRASRRRSSRPAPPCVLTSPTSADADKIAAIDDHQEPRRPGRARAARRRSRRCVRRRARRRRRRHHHGQGRTRHLGRPPERLVRPVARLGPAARRHRPRHHLRRHGRHQHGPRRDGHARRLHDLRRAGNHPQPTRRGCSTGRWRSRFPLAFLVSGLVGIVIERGIIRFLYGRPLETLLATWGVSLILQQAVRTIFGPNNREVGNPSWMSGAFDLGNLTITYNRMWIIVFAIGVFVAAADGAALHLVRPADARRHPEPRRWRAPWASAPRGSMRSPSASAPASPALPAWRSARSTTSARTSARATSSTASWSSSSAASAICGARSSAPLSLGIANKFLEPYAGAVLGKIVDPRLHHPVHPAPSARPVRAQGQGGRSMIGRFFLRGIERIDAPRAARDPRRRRRRAGCSISTRRSAARSMCRATSCRWSAST